MTLSDLEALARAATPGPWRLDEHGGVVIGRPADFDRPEDAYYIAACSPDVVLKLIAVARAAMAEIDSICRCPDCKAEGNGESELMRAVDALEKP